MICSSFLGRSSRGATRQELGLWGAGPCEFPAFNHQPTRWGTAGRAPASQGGCSASPPGTLSTAVLAPSPPSGPVAEARSCHHRCSQARWLSPEPSSLHCIPQAPRGTLQTYPPWQPEPACPPTQGGRVGPTRLLKAAASTARPGGTRTPRK